MRSLTFAILAAVFAAPLGTAASAAEFDGPFVGAQVGWQSEKLKDLESSFGDVPVNESRQSVTGGLFAGYDKAFDERFVAGAEAGLDFASDDEVRSSLGATRYTVDPKHAFDLTIRAGYLINPQTLLYLRGGYANARVRTTIIDALGIESGSQSTSGWLIGPGAERQLNDQFSARVEYRYSQFSEDDSKHQRHRMLAGLSYRF